MVGWDGQVGKEYRGIVFVGARLEKEEQHECTRLVERAFRVVPDGEEKVTKEG